MMGSASGPGHATDTYSNDRHAGTGHRQALELAGAWTGRQLNWRGCAERHVGVAAHRANVRVAPALAVIGYRGRQSVGGCEVVGDRGLLMSRARELPPYLLASLENVPRNLAMSPAGQVFTSASESRFSISVSGCRAASSLAGSCRGPSLPP